MCLVLFSAVRKVHEFYLQSLIVANMNLHVEVMFYSMLSRNIVTEPVCSFCANSNFGASLVGGDRTMKFRRRLPVLLFFF